MVISAEVENTRLNTYASSSSDTSKDPADCLEALANSDTTRPDGRARTVVSTTAGRAWASGRAAASQHSQHSHNSSPSRASRPILAPSRGAPDRAGSSRAPEALMSAGKRGTCATATPFPGTPALTWWLVGVSWGLLPALARSKPVDHRARAGQEGCGGQQRVAGAGDSAAAVGRDQTLKSTWLKMSEGNRERGGLIQAAIGTASVDAALVVLFFYWRMQLLTKKRTFMTYFVLISTIFQLVLDMASSYHLLCDKIVWWDVDSWRSGV